MLIRLLDATDSITALTQLLHAAYASLGEMGFNYTAVDQTDAVTRERIECGDCFIAVDGTRLAGTVMLLAPGNDGGCEHYKRLNVATIGQFGVLPERQGQGVGNLLLCEAERRAVLIGATDLALDTSEGADHLIAWYERRGFRVVERAHWPGKSYHSVVMNKSLLTTQQGILHDNL
jgi:GNAT superfamily N-acetyltransferase